MHAAKRVTLLFETPEEFLAKQGSILAAGAGASHRFIPLAAINSKTGPQTFKAALFGYAFFGKHLVVYDDTSLPSSPKSSEQLDNLAQYLGNHPKLEKICDRVLALNVAFENSPHPLASAAPLRGPAAAVAAGPPVRP